MQRLYLSSFTRIQEHLQAFTKIEHVLNEVTYGTSVLMMEWSTGGIANKRQKNVGKFYHSSLFKMARCWAKVPNIEWERIRDPLFNQCPQPPLKDQETQQLHKNKRNAIESQN